MRGRIREVGLSRCGLDHHPRPDLAQRIAQAIERDLDDRRGMGFDDIDEDTQYEIRRRWAEIIRREIGSQPGGSGP